MKMKNENVDFNYKDCFKTQINLGYDTYYNICNGEKTDIAWGTGFYFVIFIVLVLIVSLIIAIVFIVKED